MTMNNHSIIVKHVFLELVEWRLSKNLNVRKNEKVMGKKVVA